MATCRNCHVSSRVDPEAMEVDEVLEAPPLGTWSLSGTQLKTPVSRGLRLKCLRCGWYILGHIGEDGSFYGDPKTESYPYVPGENA